MGCTRQQEIHKHLESVIHARVQAPRRIHGPPSTFLSFSSRYTAAISRGVSLLPFFRIFALPKEKIRLYIVYIWRRFIHTSVMCRVWARRRRNHAALRVLSMAPHRVHVIDAQCQRISPYSSPRLFEVDKKSESPPPPRSSATAQRLHRNTVHSLSFFIFLFPFTALFSTFFSHLISYFVHLQG